jgi:hypothetical protein
VPVAQVAPVVRRVPEEVVHRCKLRTSIPYRQTPGSPGGGHFIFEHDTAAEQKSELAVLRGRQSILSVQRSPIPACSLKISASRT